MRESTQSVKPGLQDAPTKALQQTNRLRQAHKTSLLGLSDTQLPCRLAFWPDSLKTHEFSSTQWFIFDQHSATKVWAKHHQQPLGHQDLLFQLLVAPGAFIPFLLCRDAQGRDWGITIWDSSPDSLLFNFIITSSPTYKSLHSPFTRINNSFSLLN